MKNLYAILGPPGTGKTTSTSAWMVKQAGIFGPSQVAACSFTKAGAVQLASACPSLPEQNVGTLHSFCFRALGRPTLATKKLKSFNEAFPGSRLSGVQADTNSPYSERDAKETLGDRLLEATELLRARRVPRAEWPSHVLPFADRWDDWKKQTGVMDFTDLLEVCLRDVEAFPGDPMVLCLDEAQDSSRLQLDLLLKWSASMSKFVVAGDDDQVLYQWCGVDPGGLIDFVRALPDDHVTTLAHSYRVPRVVHALAERWIKRSRDRLVKLYHPRDEEGVLRRGLPAFKTPRYLVQQAEKHAAAGRSVLFLASCGYMLHPVIKELKERGVPFHNPYRPARADWSPLVPGEKGRVRSVDRVMSFLREDASIFGEHARFWSGDDVFRWAEKLPADGLFRHGGKKWLASLKGNLLPIEALDLLEWLTPDAGDQVKALGFSSPEAVKRSLEWLCRRATSVEARKLHYPARVVSSRGAAGLLEAPQIMVGTVH